MYGPLVLAGRLGQNGLAKPMFYPGYDTAPRGEAIPVPAIAIEGVGVAKQVTRFIEHCAGRGEPGVERDVRDDRGDLVPGRADGERSTDVPVHLGLSRRNQRGHGNDAAVAWR